jgi:hypothetical protein
MIFEPSFEASEYINKHHKPDEICYDDQFKAHCLWWD